MADAPAHRDLRAGDSDREAVARVLHDAHGEGRLDLGEVDERLATVYASRTYGELEAVVADLPGVRLPWVATTAVPAPVPAGPPLTLTASMASEKRVGVWEVPAHIVAVPSGSDVKLDFREAICPHERVHIEVHGSMGSLVLIVPDDWSVDTDGVSSGWGSVKNRHRAPAAPGRPTIVVTGKAGMGTVKTRGAYFYE
ncbi:DUF1707 SHOCT-like domain-containing protein [Actinomycetospora soli]|uniref:DUF1707 SHOCT-like domain-containing protein n=1 Tax=Actinomycetospora soli TaxID=2893887 RepID=UPI001E3B66C7|nr:DUF1707 domain-containing protein [Actinomycetospora soli]MCD2190582.1 DUF1707 domain-containing protein [Actinomycetospora soli]